MGCGCGCGEEGCEGGQEGGVGEALLWHCRRMLWTVRCVRSGRLMWCFSRSLVCAGVTMIDVGWKIPIRLRLCGMFCCLRCISVVTPICRPFSTMCLRNSIRRTKLAWKRNVGH